MSNRVIRGLQKILFYKTKIVFRSEYDEKKKEKDRERRLERLKEKEEKKTTIKHQIMRIIIRYRVGFLMIFFELILIILSFLFNEVFWVRILLYVLIPLFLLLSIIGFVQAHIRKK